MIVINVLLCHDMNEFDIFNSIVVEYSLLNVDVVKSMDIVVFVIGYNVGSDVGVFVINLH